jgi:hypothetical protein
MVYTTSALRWCSFGRRLGCASVEALPIGCMKNISIVSSRGKDQPIILCKTPLTKDISRKTCPHLLPAAENATNRLTASMLLHLNTPTSSPEKHLDPSHCLQRRETEEDTSRTGKSAVQGQRSQGYTWTGASATTRRSSHMSLRSALLYPSSAWIHSTKISSAPKMLQQKMHIPHPARFSQRRPTADTTPLAPT